MFQDAQDHESDQGTPPGDQGDGHAPDPLHLAAALDRQFQVDQRAKLLAEASRMLTSLGVPSPDRRAVDFIGIMNGLLYDRLVGNGVRGTHVDAAAVLTAWLTGAGARR